MDNYLLTLRKKAEASEVSLLEAFKCADIPTSTYYRNINEVVEMSYSTAKKVYDAIEHLCSLYDARDYSEELRKNGKRVNPRTIRARIKPRRSSGKDRMHNFSDS